VHATRHADVTCHTLRTRSRTQQVYSILPVRHAFPRAALYSVIRCTTVRAHHLLIAPPGKTSALKALLRERFPEAVPLGRVDKASNPCCGRPRAGSESTAADVWDGFDRTPPALDAPEIRANVFNAPQRRPCASVPSLTFAGSQKTHEIQRYVLRACSDCCCLSLVTVMIQRFHLWGQGPCLGEG